jgi:hypothetical protein
VLSSGGGRDFGAFLGGLGQLGYGFAYRVLDAQFVRVDGFGRAVPQRRRRVFVVGYLGDWRRAAAVLFDAASLYGDSAPRRQAGQGAAPTLARALKAVADSGPTSTATAQLLYTPREYFAAFRVRFDLDPCSPGRRHWVPARRVYTKRDDGLRKPWRGVVFMNPPFGGRLGQVPWLEKFLAHGNGIAIVRAYTSASWFHDYAIKAKTLLFPLGKTKFVPSPRLRRVLESQAPDGIFRNAPGHGVVLLGMGRTANAALARCGLGFFIDLRKRGARQ